MHYHAPLVLPCTTMQSRAHLVHLSCTSKSNHCRGTSRSLAIGTSYSCTSRVLLNLVHLIFVCLSCTFHAPLILVHLSCTSRAPPITVVGLPGSLAVGTSYSCTSRALLNLLHYSISCTTQSRALLSLMHLTFVCLSCTSRAPHILVHLSCTNRSRAPLVHLQSLSWDFTLPDRRHSYSCRSRALSCTSHALSCTTRTAVHHHVISCSHLVRSTFNYSHHSNLLVIIIYFCSLSLFFIIPTV